MNPKHWRILIDTPSRNPALGYDGYAQALADIINDSTPQFAIGVFGGWGSGKTTLMQEVRNRVDNSNAVCVDFSAWRYEKEDHLIIPLLATIKDALADWSNDQNNPQLKEKIQSAMRTISSVITSLVAGLGVKCGIPSAFELSFSMSRALDEAANQDEIEHSEDTRLTSIYYSCFEALRRGFSDVFGEDTERRVVIFVDDLDRCLPGGVLQVLESMKLFFDLHGFVFVVGLDQPVVEWCVDQVYKTQDVNSKGNPSYQFRGSDYIKKIFQVPFSLFPVSIVEIDQLLDNVIAENQMNEEQADDIREVVRPHVNYVVGDSGLNPREIKRFINAYTLTMKITPTLDQQSVLALRTIAFRPDWKVVQEALYAYGEVFLHALRAQVNGEVGALANLHRDLAAVPESFLTYVSAGGPGRALLDVMVLDDYIRSGAVTDSRSDPRLLEYIRKLGKCRGLIEDAATEEVLLEVAGRISQLISEVEENVGMGERRRSSPFVDAALRSLMVLRSKLEEGASVFGDPIKMSAWRDVFDKCLSDTISSLVGLFQTGGRV